MDGYPLGSLDHNVPLIFVSGINPAREQATSRELKDHGILIRSDLPCLDSREASFLATYLDRIDTQGLSWTAVSRDEQYRLRIKAVGRSILLPPRRAPVPDSIEPFLQVPVLHSPYSPLSPSSSLYPDGLIDARWVGKHQEQVPSMVACFYSLTSDPTAIASDDNRMKADINNIKSGLARSGYKTRLAVIILGDEETSEQALADTVLDRLESIRRGAGLDPKSIFYIPNQESPTEFQHVVDSILGALYSVSIEYYKDLARHARKKRSRGFAPHPTIPPTSGTSQTLSLPDWNFRYDFKSAIFAEFRHENDLAIRSFEQAYEILLSQDILDLIPSWSPRWNEARLLTDIISIRCLRLHLWMGQTSMAARRWQAHRERVAYVVENQGRGTNNYGWPAWEARWAMVMAHLIERVEVPGLVSPPSAIYLLPEKALQSERLKPWEMLHHTGYWYRLAAGHLEKRRELALGMSEEDRGAPDASPASQVASKAYMYDTYLCPPPHKELPLRGIGVNHSQMIIDCLIDARTQFQARKQHRLAAEVALECAREMASQQAWGDVVALLRPMWEDSSFRSERWWDVSEDMLWLLRRAAAGSGRAELVIPIDWELMDKRYTKRPKWHYNLERSLEGVELETQPSISISDDTVPSFVSSTFVFRNKDGRAGETSLAQLSLKSDAIRGAAPVLLSSIEVRFSGNLKPILIEHDSEGTASASTDITTVSAVSLTEEFENEEREERTLDEEIEDVKENKGSRRRRVKHEGTAQLKGKGDLTLKPGQRRVFEMRIPLRESGDVQALSVKLTYRTETFGMHYALKFRKTDQVTGWFMQGSAKARLPRPDAHSLHVLPRPPKMKLKLDQPFFQYYASETIELRIHAVNEEDAAANVKLDVSISGDHVPRFEVEAGEQIKATDAAAKNESRVSGLALGALIPSSSRDLIVRIDPAPGPTTYEVQVKALYHLESDTATPIVQLLPVDLNVVNAFEANYDLLPRLHPDPWPSLFDTDGLDALDDDGPAQARGLIQRWCLACHYASFANEDLDVLGMDLAVTSASQKARFNVLRRPEFPEQGTLVAPKTMYEAAFDFMVQKLSLDDRHPVTIDLGLTIRWRRRDAAPREGAGNAEGRTEKAKCVNSTTMSIGQHLVLGSEPRVVGSVMHLQASAGSTTPLLQLDVTIENPSSHFLTFGLTMEPSDTFAFSGSKQTTLNLLPMSRRTRSYRLLPLVRGSFIRPGLVVRDKYFQKVLRVIPTEGMKIDKEGLLIWVPSEGGAGAGGVEES